MIGVGMARRAVGKGLRGTAQAVSCMPAVASSASAVGGGVARLATGAEWGGDAEGF
jgi:hypothetical protein